MMIVSDAVELLDALPIHGEDVTFGSILINTWQLDRHLRK